jgi:hypothetical protein
LRVKKKFICFNENGKNTKKGKKMERRYKLNLLNYFLSNAPPEPIDSFKDMKSPVKVNWASDMM